MRNSAYEKPSGRRSGLAELLENPLFTNAVRLFIAVVLALGGYIWQSELSHLHQAVEHLRGRTRADLQRQHEELRAVKQELWQLNRDLNRTLYRTNRNLTAVLKRLEAREGARPPARAEP